LESKSDTGGRGVIGKSAGKSVSLFLLSTPVDKRSFSYGLLWNAFKRVAQGLDAESRDALFFGTAAQVYGLSLSHVKGP
jgi:hypothetical protein